MGIRFWRIRILKMRIFYQKKTERKKIKTVTHRLVTHSGNALHACCAFSECVTGVLRILSLRSTWVFLAVFFGNRYFGPHTNKMIFLSFFHSMYIYTYTHTHYCLLFVCFNFISIIFYVSIKWPLPCHCMSWLSPCYLCHINKKCFHLIRICNIGLRKKCENVYIELLISNIQYNSLSDLLHPC